MTRLDYPNRQPALDIIRKQARTVAGVKRLLGPGVTYHQLRSALIGEMRPTPEIRQGLSLLLNRTPEELWTPNMLAEDTEAVSVA